MGKILGKRGKSTVAGEPKTKTISRANTNKRATSTRRNSSRQSAGRRRSIRLARSSKAPPRKQIQVARRPPTRGEDKLEFSDKLIINAYIRDQEQIYGKIQNPWVRRFLSGINIPGCKKITAENLRKWMKENDDFFTIELIGKMVMYGSPKLRRPSAQQKSGKVARAKTAKATRQEAFESREQKVEGNPAPDEAEPEGESGIERKEREESDSPPQYAKRVSRYHYRSPKQQRAAHMDADGDEYEEPGISPVLI